MATLADLQQIATKDDLAAVVTELRRLAALVEQRQRYVSTADAALALGCSVRSIKRMASDGRLSVIRRGRLVRVDLASVQAVNVAELAADARGTSGRRLRAIGGK